MPAYNATLFDPPAPTANVVLRDPRPGKTVADVLLLLDTGADLSLVPQVAVQQLDVAPIPGSQYELMGFDGSISVSPAAQLELIFLNRTFRGRYLLIDQPWGVLGRDILNLLALCFDGPLAQWHDQRPVKQ